jgi:hypothetical protein
MSTAVNRIASLTTLLKIEVWYLYVFVTSLYNHNLKFMRD